jgi:glycolate oxidase FAD binding subunit
VTAAVDSVRTELESIVGESHVAVDPAACASFAVDGKVPSYILYPDTAGKVAATLRCAAENELAVIPCRNGTKLATGSPPRRYDVALSLKEMTRVWHFEAADLTIGLEPGMKFGDFQEFIGRHGLWLPLDPRGGSRASIGGIIAANAAGLLRQGFGGPRDMVLGLKIATTDGNIVKTGGRVVKNVAGYDLGKLMIGSYGSLGVIVEANLKLYPKPPERVTFAIRVSALDQARDLRRSLLRSPLDALRLVLLDSTAVDLLCGGGPFREQRHPELWIELGGSHRVIQRCENDLAKLASSAGASLARRDGAEAAWNCISDLPAWLHANHPGVVVLKVALPIAASEEFLSLAQQPPEGVRLAGFAQVGVGIIHVGVLPETPSADLDALVARLRKTADALGGTLVVEHCPTEIKERMDVWGPTGDDFGAMREMKLVWDPKGILSPGRFVGGL